MQQRLKNVVIKSLERTELFMLYALRRHGFLADVGWFESWRAGRPVDRVGKPLPWFTYPAISFLEKRLTPEMVVYEYGCGNSTYWWSSRVSFVFSCEHSADWYEAIKSKLPVNVQLGLYEIDQYAESIHGTKRKFDVVVIDGRQRVACMKTCDSALADNGVIIVDNSDLPEYGEGLDFLRSRGFKDITFDGPGPVTSNSWRTSIFYRPGTNILDI